MAKIKPVQVKLHRLEKSDNVAHCATKKVTGMSDKQSGSKNSKRTSSKKGNTYTHIYIFVYKKKGKRRGKPNKQLIIVYNIYILFIK